jgi:hypothetical protein
MFEMCTVNPNGQPKLLENFVLRKKQDILLSELPNVFLHTKSTPGTLLNWKMGFRNSWW